MKIKQAIDTIALIRGGYQKLLEECVDEGTIVGTGFKGTWKTKYPTTGYKSIAVKACDIAISALEKQVGKKPHPDGDQFILACPCCRSGEYLHNFDDNQNQYCGQCGQKIDWEVLE